jgi:O-antigen/teichoic acid export membrane protein
MSSSSPVLARTPGFDPAAVTGRPAVPLRIGFSWSLVGWIGYAGCQWFMLSIMAKLGNPALVGRFAFALALSAPLFMLTNLQLRGVQSTDARNEFTFSDYVTLRVIGSAIAVTSILALSIFLRLTWAAAAVVLLVAIFKALESLGDVSAGLMQKFEMLDSAAIALLLRGGISIGLFGVAFALWRSLPIALLIWVCAAGVVISSYDFSVARKLAVSEGGIRWRLDWPTLQTLTITSLPLGFVSAIASLNTNIPRYTIERTLSVSDLGIFASVAYPVTAATITANSLGQSALARLSRLSVEGRLKEFKVLVLKLVAVGASLGAVAVILVLTCGRWLLSNIYTPEYAKHERLFALLALIAGLNAIACFLSYGLTAARQFRVQLPITMACTLSTFIFSVILVPHFKLMGAGFALLISVLLMIGMAGTVLWRVLSRLEKGAGRESHQAI